MRWRSPLAGLACVLACAGAVLWLHDDPPAAGWGRIRWVNRTDAGTVNPGGPAPGVATQGFAAGAGVPEWEHDLR